MYISICESWHHGHETMQSQLGFAHKDCAWLYRCFQQTVVSEISCKNICCNLSVWVLGVLFASQQDKRRADLIYERNVGPKSIVYYFLQDSMREKIHWVNSCWLICSLLFFSILKVSELWSSSSYWKKKDNTCLIELTFMALLVKGQRRTGHFCL